MSALDAGSEVPFARMFDAIYATDLVYEKDCWKKCEDAHCCHFSRYKSGSSRGRQEIPLLPGEWRYMETRGLLAQYARPRRTVLTLDLEAGPIRYESLVVDASGCPCTHDLRPTVCRLYPLLPRFRPGIGLAGIDTAFTLFDELEVHLGVPPACKVRELSFAEMANFLKICGAIAEEPVAMFSVEAYRVVKSHLRSALVGFDQKTVPALLAGVQKAIITRKLFRWDVIKRDLDALAQEFSDRVGDAFALR